MPAQRLDGKALAATMRAEIAARVAARTAKGQRPPGLAAVLVGEDPASQTYVRNKHKACHDAGLASAVHTLPASTTQAGLLELVARLNADPAVHGILVQLPLPKQIDEGAVIRAVAPAKDVDCFHPENVGLLAAGFPRFYPCTPHGVLQLLSRNGIGTAGKEVVVVGRSNIVGKPLALMLMQKPTAASPAAGDATVTVAHTRTADLAAVCRRADVLVAAVGRAGVITPDMVKPGAAVVDVGTNSVNGKLVGDVHPDVGAVAGWLSPVPGGVGPMTITMLLYNTLSAAEQIDG
ncbi:bifunctional 5,10-methylenetetrahydrofolate dehydrogenase/5,10-methenyltetrahydrofolate cyclohydrolase [Frigoriglobus tundricola]|uniref:Bifunctional protein FolD n=1 Tax=Frigoriglobus tundricola TaxID=2774151 RepID=A0A6M5YZQ2_9BACT|nr:bifunctional 5,10-methylenetetrahydrofolate dehydrogenase/5,10-methenyltetrahydrofolate cyclohydrolase [Frigoriglobus tundricola]QJW99358.1 Methenyltetrahydrofolate cyclohydrolase / Methylenetetrahydrofolate dehydrogenase (NADP+) [Frigoriglobus tundricola]